MSIVVCKGMLFLCGCKTALMKIILLFLIFTLIQSTTAQETPLEIIKSTSPEAFGKGRSNFDHRVNSQEVFWDKVVTLTIEDEDENISIVSYELKELSKVEQSVNFGGYYIILTFVYNNSVEIEGDTGSTAISEIILEYSEDDHKKVLEALKKIAS